MRLLTLMGHPPDLPAEMIEFDRARDEMGRQAKERVEAELRQGDPASLREIIATLERIDGGFPELGRVQFQLATSYCTLGSLELHRASAELGAVKLFFALRGALNGKPPVRPEVEAALARFDKALEISAGVSTPRDPSDRKAYRDVEGIACMGRGAALAQLGRFTEASMAFDRATGLAEGPHRLALMKLRSIFLKAAEIEQSHMPWSPPNRADHDRAIRMADFLVDQPGVSPAAVFNAACAYSLASLDEGAGDAGRERRASRAVALLRLIEGKGYFRGSKQAGELREDKALDPLRPRADFRALAERVAKGK
jgi:tetratricopeptide (TPR) repeat protein